MIILITVASHTGKTILAQRMLEKYNYPYFSMDHLKMGLIRSGNTDLTPEDDEELVEYPWPIVREMIKTAIENNQNLIIEGCYVPFDWRQYFDEQYLQSIRFICLAMSDEYIEAHFNGIKEHGYDIEARLDDSYCTIDQLKEDNHQMMSDTDGSFNFLISMIYTQLFNLLCEKADDVYGGRLPIHVRCLIDEAANIGQIPNLEKLVATIRSREISACLVLQAKSQLKAIYKDNADTIIGNMDSQVFLGGSEPTTLKDLSEALGKETIDTFNTSDTRGNSPSYGTNYQKLGKELMSRDEIAVLDGSKCVLQLRGVRPFLSDKYDLTQHPNYKYTADFDKRYTFDIEKYLNRRIKLKKDDVFDVVEA